MAKNQSDTQPLEAFKVYVAMGPKRSINALEARLHELGHRVSRTTLMRWQKKFEWEKHVATELEAQAHEINLVAQAAAERRQAEDEAGEPFTAEETLEGTANALQAMTAGMALVVAAAMKRYLEQRSSVAIDLKDLLAIARTAGETANAVATIHKALHPPAITVKGEDPKRDADTGLLEGSLAPGGGARPGVEDLLAAFANPPIRRVDPPAKPIAK